MSAEDINTEPAYDDVEHNAAVVQKMIKLQETEEEKANTIRAFNDSIKQLKHEISDLLHDIKTNQLNIFPKN